MSRRGAQLVKPPFKEVEHPKPIYDQQYTLTILPSGAIRIERQGHGQSIPHEVLLRHGVNSVAHSAGLIEQKIAGRVF